MAKGDYRNLRTMDMDGGNPPRYDLVAKDGRKPAEDVALVLRNVQQEGDRVGSAEFDELFDLVRDQHGVIVDRKPRFVTAGELGAVSMVANEAAGAASTAQGTANEAKAAADGALKPNTDINVNSINLTGGSIATQGIQTLLLQPMGYSSLSSHLIPSQTNTYSLGSNIHNFRWNYLFLNHAPSIACDSAVKKQVAIIDFDSGETAGEIIGMLRTLSIRAYKRYDGSKLGEEVELGVFIDDVKDHKQFDLIGRGNVNEETGKTEYSLDTMSWATAAHLRAEHATRKAERLARLLVEKGILTQEEANSI